MDLQIVFFLSFHRQVLLSYAWITAFPFCEHHYLCVFPPLLIIIKAHNLDVIREPLSADGHRRYAKWHDRWCYPRPAFTSRGFRISG
jgi:hypothetical protein